MGEIEPEVEDFKCFFFCGAEEFRRRLLTDKFDDRVRAFEHSFGPRRRVFERSNLQKFKCPGGGGMLKFRVDRRIITSFVNVSAQKTLSTRSSADEAV